MDGQQSILQFTCFSSFASFLVHARSFSDFYTRAGDDCSYLRLGCSGGTMFCPSPYVAPDISFGRRHAWPLELIGPLIRSVLSSKQVCRHPRRYCVVFLFLRLSLMYFYHHGVCYINSEPSLSFICTSSHVPLACVLGRSPCTNRLSLDRAIWLLLGAGLASLVWPVRQCWGRHGAPS